MRKIDVNNLPNDLEDYVDYLRDLSIKDLKNEIEINKRLDMEYKNEIIFDRFPNLKNN